VEIFISDERQKEEMKEAKNLHTKLQKVERE
jgi:hypothetical protein